MPASIHPREFNPSASGPLTGIRVLDLSRLVAGNMLTHLLADFGAEVIKIEKPGFGDDLRNWKVNGIETYWKVYSRNKKSLTLSLSNKKGIEIFGKLIRTAHVLVENFVPGTMERFGITEEWLRSINEHLVVVRISGWGQTGPFSKRPGFGTLVEAMSGFAAANGFDDKPPVLPPLALADMVAGVYGVAATMIALRHIEVSGGIGQTVDLSLFEPMIAILGPQAANYRVSGDVPSRMGNRSPVAAPRNVYLCSDGLFVALSASMQSMVEKLFRAIDRPDLISDPRFSNNEARLAHADELDGIVEEFVASRTQAENLEHFEALGITVGPVCDAAQLTTHPYVVEREVLVDIPDEQAGRLPMHNVTPRLSETPGVLRRPAPTIGQDNIEVLKSVGIDNEYIGELEQLGIV